MQDIFDQQATLVRMGQDHGLFREMVAMLLEDSPLLLGQTAAACERDDASEVRRLAHSLKGMAANFSAGRAVRAAARTEQAAGGENWTAVQSSLPELREAFQELCGALKLVATPE
ncbi:MAG: Hpt domain-containing protein [Pirellulales bacterium]